MLKKTNKETKSAAAEAHAAPLQGLYGELETKEA